MRKFQMEPNGEYQEKMTEALYNAGYRYDIDLNVLTYLRTHMSNREPRKLLEGYLSDQHVKQLGSMTDEISNYSGPYNTRYIRSMIEALCVEGGTSQQVNVNASLVHINWNDMSDKYYDLDESDLRTEYARVRKIARNNRDDQFDLIIKQDLIDELNLEQQ